MHYYQFNIKDYQSHTGHLDEFEDLAYRRLLDWCYLHERPLPLEQDEIARLIRMRTHSECIASVLREFFVRTEDGWISPRVMREIDAVNDKSEKARNSAMARWDKQQDANALPTQSEGNAPITHNPLPTTQVKEANASLSGTGFPPCPQQELLSLYRKHLPHLPYPRIWEGTRSTHMRQRWIQAGKPSSYSPEGYKTQQDGLKWWDSFFAYIAADTKLRDGFESNGRVWRPDLAWIVNANNFAKIIDGKYQK